MASKILNILFPSKSTNNDDLPLNEGLDIGDGAAKSIVGEVFDHVERLFRASSLMRY